MNNGHDTDGLEETPLLRGLPKTDPFVAPDGFFDQFPASVKQRIAHGAKRSRWSDLFPFHWLNWQVALLAGMLVVGLVVWSLRPSAGPALDPSLALDAPEAMPDELNMDDLDDSEIWAMYANDPDLLTSVGHGFDAEELEAYVLNQELPVELLIEEL